MSWILNIDTAITKASVCLAKDGQVVDLIINDQLKDHAAWLQYAIKEQASRAGIHVKDLAAVALSNGPGSYTGLRIGLSTAKGLCFALNIPLIAIGSLPMMAAGADHLTGHLICPMIDARRMEVFTAVYNANGDTILAPCAMILDSRSFEDLLSKQPIQFFGNGCMKLKPLITHEHASFENIEINASQLVKISYHRLLTKQFDSLAYTEPMYIKSFHNPAH